MSKLKCKGTTRKGNRCRLPADRNSSYCRFHTEPGKESKLRGLKLRRSPISKEERAARDQRLALIVTTGLALVQLLEKVMSIGGFRCSPVGYHLREFGSEMRDAGASVDETWDILTNWIVEFLDDSQFFEVIDHLELTIENRNDT